MDTLQHIRNACVKIQYAGKTFLVDPMLSPKGTYPGFEGTLHAELRNPLVELPISIEKLLHGIDAIIVTHTHLDHWDDAAVELLPKDLPLFAQHEGDAKIIRDQGFTDVRILEKSILFEGINIIKTGGKHGPCAMFEVPQLATLLGNIMGVVFQAPNHKTVYIAGDTIWREEVDSAIETYAPDYLVLNAGNAMIDGFNESIIMGKEDTYKACQVAGPNAKVIAIHMDAINHCALSRAELREYIQEKAIVDRVLIPEDGEVIQL